MQYLSATLLCMLKSFFAYLVQAMPETRRAHSILYRLFLNYRFNKKKKRKKKGVLPNQRGK
jgi:hypothetical protein